MKKAILGVMVVFVLLSGALIIYKNQDKFEYYDTNNKFGKSPNCKVSSQDELICKKGKSWIKVNQYSLGITK